MAGLEVSTEARRVPALRRGAGPPDAAAGHYAEIRADLKKRGTPIGATDLFIAAHARGLGLRLVTNNTAKFGRVKGLAIENWTLPGRRPRSTDDK